MKAEIYVTYKDGILDPEGNTVRKALKSIGIKKVEMVRFGKYIEMEFDGATRAEAEKLADDACRKLLSNHNTETYRYEIVES